jgi:cell shape-determining protein MreC
MLIDHRRKKGTQKRWLVAGVLVVVAACMALLFHLAPPRAVKQLGMFFARPLWQTRLSASSGASGVSGIFSSKTALERDNTLLHEELQNARLALIHAQLVEKENEELKSLLGRIDTSTYVLGWVLSRPADTPYDTLIIDAGSAEGIATGDAVLGEAPIALGVVAEVFTRTSRVALFSSPDVETQVVFPASGTVSTARGLGGGNFIVRIPQEEVPAENTPVVLSGESSRILGFVSAVEHTPGDVFATVRFRTPVNLSTLTRVLVKVSSGT